MFYAVVGMWLRAWLGPVETVSARAAKSERTWEIRGGSGLCRPGVQGHAQRLGLRAVIAAGAYGTYKYEPGTVEDLRAFLHNQEVVAGVPSPDGLLRTLDTGRVVVSRIGYEATAQRIRDWTGRHVPLSRETSAMRPGDVAMVIRLKYRVDPHTKKAHRPDRDAWEIGRLERLK